MHEFSGHQGGTVARAPGVCAPPLGLISNNQVAKIVTALIRDATSLSARACLVVDADRTLGSADTGRMVGQNLGIADRITHEFRTLGYTDDAFVAVSRIWSEVPVTKYNTVVDETAGQISLYPEWVEVFDAIRLRVPTLIVSAGIPQAWRRALESTGNGRIAIVGGCHAAVDEFVLSASAKGRIVSRLREEGLKVIAAGDSLVDFPMLRAASHPIVVCDMKGSKSLIDAMAGERIMLRQFVTDSRPSGRVEPCTTDELVRLVMEEAC